MCERCDLEKRVAELEAELECVTLERDLVRQHQDEPKTPAEIAAALRILSERMKTVGAAMDYYGGFGNMADRGREMVGAALMAEEWAENIEGVTTS